MVLNGRVNEPKSCVTSSLAENSGVAAYNFCVSATSHLVAFSEVHTSALMTEPLIMTTVYQS